MKCFEHLVLLLPVGCENKYDEHPEQQYLVKNVTRSLNRLKVLNLNRAFYEDKIHESSELNFMPL
ncbi:MAG: hypothetical protein EOP45_01095 [Sphingobacteriaceae bacterium]|nr:MAG: hypothetical protein EOP45_01095 [Sphingobacteriaceae bacterium]